jgi:hypothetical protein
MFKKSISILFIFNLLFVISCIGPRPVQKGNYYLSPKIIEFEEFFKNPDYKNSGIICGEFSTQFLATPTDGRITSEAHSLKFIKNQLVQQTAEVYGYNKNSDKGRAKDLNPHHPYFFIIVPAGDYNPNELFWYYITRFAMKNYNNIQYETTYFSPHFLLTDKTKIKLDRHEMVYIGNISLKSSYPVSDGESAYKDLVSRLPTEKSSKLPSIDKIKSDLFGETINNPPAGKIKQYFGLYYVDCEDNFDSFTKYIETTYGNSKAYSNLIIKKLIIDPIGLSFYKRN